MVSYATDQDADRAVKMFNGWDDVLSVVGYMLTTPVQVRIQWSGTQGPPRQVFALKYWIPITVVAYPWLRQSIRSTYASTSTGSSERLSV
jgi:hypothetical protein